MSIKQVLIVTGVLLIFVFGFVSYCDRTRVTPTEPGKLAPNENVRVEYRGKTVTVIRADKTTKTYVPDGGKVHVFKNGEVKVSYKKMGLCVQPGISAAYNGDKLKMAFDLKLAYYSRLGGHLGVTYDPTKSRASDILRPLAFASYELPYDGFVNTSLWVGTELFPQRLSGGIRLAF